MQPAATTTLETTPQTRLREALPHQEFPPNVGCDESFERASLFSNVADVLLHTAMLQRMQQGKSAMHPIRVTSTCSLRRGI